MKEKKRSCLSASRLFFLGIGLLALVCLSGSSLAGPNSGAGIALDLDPATPGIQSTRTVALNQTFDADIIAQNVVNLKAFDFKLLYDSTKLEVVPAGVTEEPFLPSSGKTTFFLKDLTQPDTIWLSDSISGSDPALAPDGTGIIAHVSFTVIGSGENSLSLNGVKFFDSNSVENDISLVGNGTINPLRR